VRARLSLGLSRELWLVQAGIFLNMLGYGAVLPFEIIYLHNGRGFSVGVAGLVLGAVTGVAVVAAPMAGPLIDRHGARAVAVGAGIALAASIFAGACLLVIASGHTGAAYPLLLIASVAAGAGECFHTTALMPLVADLAPPGLRGRYMASIGLSWWAGLAIAPTLGAQLLGRSPDATFLAAAVAAAAAAVSALTLERRLPAAAVRTPHPRQAISR
jgi:MFS family permease